MSPVPLIARQRALSRIGELHGGDEKQDGKVGKKLKTWRATTQQRDVAERFAQAFGGEVKSWQGPSGDAWQVISARDVLPVLIMPEHSLRLSYEKWEGASKRTRVCDGEEEVLSGQPCICNAQGKDECQITVRLMVLLPDTGSALGWQCISKGETAARELPLAMEMGASLARGSSFAPGFLRLTWRRGQRDGHATQFIVPVIDYDPRQQFAAGELPAGGSTPSLPAGYTPIATIEANGTSLEAGLKAAETQTVTRTGRSAAPIPAVDDDISFGAGPVPVPDESGASPPPLAPPADGAALSDAPEHLKPTPGQKKKIGVHIGNLRDKAGVVTTEQLWANMATARNVEVDVMIELLGGHDDEGVLHFGPLLADLNRVEAARLIDWFERVEAKAAAHAG